MNSYTIRDSRSRALGVTLTFESHHRPLVVKASEPHLSRALTNLIRNATEAIKGIGQVTVRTRSKPVTTSLAGYETIEPGRYAVVEVAYTGCGIATEELGRIFEPFFSKKRTGDYSGSGLGLAIVHSVIKEHEGFVDVQSAVGQGATFTLYFPQSHQELDRVTNASHYPAETVESSQPISERGL
jgi:signal transduction histidine kinase